MLKQNSNLLMMGLPNTGKTTFLAALWYLLNSNEKEISLDLDYVDGDTSYLTDIRQEWLECQPLARALPVLEMISLYLKNTSNNKIVIRIPDISGETYKNQWALRSCTEAYANYCNKVDGIVLFIHSENIVEPLSLSGIAPLVEGATDIADKDDDSDGGTSSSPEESKENKKDPIWDTEQTPTQVKLIDLLQFYIYDLPTVSPINIAIIISAWDLAQSNYEDPKIFLTQRLPLLYQFICNNPDVGEVQIFGVSAQGGKYTKGANEELLDKESPIERITVVNSINGDEQDLTLPLNWLANLSSKHDE